MEQIIKIILAQLFGLKRLSMYFVAKKSEKTER